MLSKMNVLTVIALFFACGSVCAQDPWKNIYSQHAWAERDKWQRADDLIRLLNISPGSVVADIGCHEGYMTFKLAETVGNVGAVYAADVGEAKLEKVRKRAEQNNLNQVKIVKAEDDNPRLPRNGLDAVIILDTYHEMDHHAEILQHIFTSLKAGGRLLICEPIADSRRELSRAEQERKHELSMHYALDDLRDAGFRVLYQRDNFIDRTKEKGDRMWVVVVVKD